MMTQGVLGFKYEREPGNSRMTAYGGLPTYLDLAQAGGLWQSIERHVKARQGGQGWTDSEMVMSLMMLNLVGGECVEDIERLEADEGFCRIFSKALRRGLKGRAGRGLAKRWRRSKERRVPSPSAIFRYLAQFHDQGQEDVRREGKAFIPKANGPLRGLNKVNRDLLRFVQKHKPERVATLDQDATLAETNKAEAHFCYQGYRAYQPLNTWWYEQGLVAHTEFRDGNVPAGHEQLRVFQEALRNLPEGVRHVRLRSDTAGYQHDLLRYCDRGENERFGRIGFAVGCDVTPAFKSAVGEVEASEWKTLGGRGEREFAEVCFVPRAIGGRKYGCEYRYLAIREPMEEQLTLPGMEGDDSLGMGFPSMDMDGAKYKVFGIVTNMDWAGEDLIRWLYQRCGKSEEVHAVMKEDLAGGKLPSGSFGENAAWWAIMVLALNLNAALKSLVLGEKWIPRRMKAIRFWLIHLPARVRERSRQLYVRLSREEPAFSWLLRIRGRIGQLAAMGPPG